jgi:hypothetical protein
LKKKKKKRERERWGTARATHGAVGGEMTLGGEPVVAEPDVVVLARLVPAPPELIQTTKKP